MPVGKKTRSVSEVIAAKSMNEGAGVPIKRPTLPVNLFDPFLMLDHFGPMDIAPGQQVGFPDHPHRGFETVTYLLQGAFEHKDSFGNHGALKAGGIQWMTAGSGLVHSEMPAREIREKGGRVEGFQVWINLAQKDKMASPNYQDLTATQIPQVNDASGLVQARVIAGETLGRRGPIETRFPVSYIHFNLQPGGAISQPVASGENAFVYVVSGQGRFGTTKLAGADDLVVFAEDGDHVAIENPAGNRAELSVLFLAGKPLREPVAWYGPFVMNTRNELVQAYEDYNAGRMGRIA